MTGAAAILEAVGVDVRAPGPGGRAPLLLSGVDAAVRPGVTLAVVGPNGAGKTTLLRTLSGRLRPVAGEVRLLGRPIRSYGPTERARRLAVLAQENPLPFALTVAEIVEMGRYPHVGRFGRPGPADRRAIASAMEAMRVAHLAGRQYPSLSGGEKQRVLLARCLAQEPSVLLLDEPTANLDLNHALELLDLVTRLAREEGLAVVIVEHRLAFARRFADEALALKEGRVFARGAPAEVLAPEVVIRLFDIEGERALREVPGLL